MYPKQMLELAGQSILQRSLQAFLRSPHVTDVVVALPRDLAKSPPAYIENDPRVSVVTGGVRRQDSVRNAFDQVNENSEVVVIHDAVRPFVSEQLIASTIDAAIKTGAAIAGLPANDTIKKVGVDGIVGDTLRREEIVLAQTPQAFRTSVLRAALSLNLGDLETTDEAALAERAGYRVQVVKGDPRNIKITTPEDLAMAKAILDSQANGLRVGHGYDLHKLVPQRQLTLGGVTIPFDKGLQGHSDADVVCHAVTDAVLGATGQGDIGQHFPDTDPVWKNANSLDLLSRMSSLVQAEGFSVLNVDVTIVAEQPRLSPFVTAMCANVADALGIETGQVSIKSKTNEGMDSMGLGKSIAAHAVVLVGNRGLE